MNFLYDRLSYFLINKRGVSRLFILPRETAKNACVAFFFNCSIFLHICNTKFLSVFGSPFKLRRSKIVISHKELPPKNYLSLSTLQVEDY